MDRVVEYYKSHNVYDTLKKFGITYRQLKQICEEHGFVKSPEEIKNTYKQTKITKHGSLENAYEEKANKQKETIMEKYGSMELYYQIRDLNAQKTNKKRTGVRYPMQNPETVMKANKSKERK